ncbi:MAG: hypothetical protein A2073_06475 [Deltaproteobacteria bacterium GWC2_42_11]|nr:MAG: hypothetical protein A2073_06475 [Deltaproteobacteria bacterium GWC2_42_11]HBO84378.1 hypothetical protein [Deltaproteobacteria bacterium]
MEERDYYLKALQDAEWQDNERMDKRMGQIEQSGDVMNEKSLLMDIRKRLAEIYFYIDKVRQ